MRDLMDDGENRAVRTFLQLVYGGVTGSITTTRMQEHLEGSGWENHTPDWAKTEHTLTKEGVQDWLRFLFAMEPVCPFVPEQTVVLKDPHLWYGGCDNIDGTFKVLVCEARSDVGSGFGVQVTPALQKHHPDGEGVWYDSTHFLVAPVAKEVKDWPIKPALFVQHQTLTHVKSGKSYGVVLTPEKCRIEATEEPAYVYQAYDVGSSSEITQGKIWVRGQKEMEDGRFVLCDQSGRSVVVDPIGRRTQAAIRELGVKYEVDMEWKEPVESLPKLTILSTGFNGQTVTNAERERMQHNSESGVFGFLMRPNETPLPDVEIQFPTPEQVSTLAKAACVEIPITNEDPENARFFARPHSVLGVMASHIEISQEQAEINKQAGLGQNGYPTSNPS